MSEFVRNCRCLFYWDELKIQKTKLLSNIVIYIFIKNKKTDRKITINGFINRLMCFYFRSKTCLKWPVGITHLTQSILLPTFLSLSHILLALALFHKIVHLSVRPYRWKVCLLWNLLFRIMESSLWCNVYEMTWGLLCRNFYSVKSLNG